MNTRELANRIAENPLLLAYPGLDSEPRFSRRYGKYSPVGMLGSDGYTRLEQMPLIQPGDIELLNKFYPSLDNGLGIYELDNNELLRLEFLDKYLDLPTFEAVHKPSYEALYRCIESDCIIPSMYLSRNTLNKMKIIDHAAKNGHVSVLHWMYNLGIDFNRYMDEFISAIQNGHLNIVQWLHSINFPLDDLIKYTGKYGQLEIIQWMHIVGVNINLLVAEKAAIDGHLNILQWLHSIGFMITHERIAYEVIHNGHMHILEWLQSINNVITPDNFKTAAFYQHLDIMKWMYSNGLVINNELSKYCNLNASLSGSVHILQWLCSIGGEMIAGDIELAVYSGHIDVLRWALSRGFKIENLQLKNMLSRNSVGAVKWLHSLGFKIDTNAACIYAAAGELQILKWMHSIGVVFDNSVAERAYNCDNSYVLHWLTSIGVLISLKERPPSD